MLIDYEIVSLEEVKEDVYYEVEDCYYDEEFDVIEELEATLAVASLLEELFGLA